MRPARFLLLATACAILPACAGTQMTPAEREIADTMGAEAFQPATRDLRDSIETQDLLTQASFWSREHRLNPADLEATIKLASVVRRMGNPARAIEITQATRALRPKDPYLLAEHAAALVAAERGAEALPLIEGGLREASGYARLWSLRGAALDQAERYDEARQSYGKALSITPYDPSILGNMGLSFALQGDYATAQKWLQKAAALPGAPESVGQNLKLVQELSGQPTAAPRSQAQSAQPVAPRPQAGLPPASRQTPPPAAATSAPTLAGPGRNMQVFAPGEAKTASDAARLAAQRGQSVPPLRANDPDALNRLARNAAASGATAPPAPRSPFAPPQQTARAPMPHTGPQTAPQARPQAYPQGYPQAYPQAYPGAAHRGATANPQASQLVPTAYPNAYPQVQVSPQPVPPQVAQGRVPPRGPARVRR